MSALAGRRECRRRVRGEAVAIGMCGSRAPWLDGGIGRYPRTEVSFNQRSRTDGGIQRDQENTEVPSDQRSDGSKLLR